MRYLRLVEIRKLVSSSVAELEDNAAAGGDEGGDSGGGFVFEEAGAWEGRSAMETTWGRVEEKYTY